MSTMTRANLIDRIIVVAVPLGFGCMIGGLIFQSEYLIASDEGIEIASKLVDVLGILFGFIITAISILLSIGNKKYVKLLCATNHLKSIYISYIVNSIYLFIALMGAVCIIIFSSWNILIQALFIGVNVSVAISTAISLYFLFMISLKVSSS